MKKLLLISAFILAITACKKDETVIPGPAITGDVKLVESIKTTYDTNQRSITYLFEYDKDNRIVKMQSTDFTYDFIEIKYSGNRLLITQHDQDYQTISDAILKDGRISQNTITDIYEDEKEEYGTMFYEYNGSGFLTNINHYVKELDNGEMEYQQSSYITWHESNLTETDYSLTFKHNGQEIKYVNTKAKITYLDKENDKINIDLNWCLLNEGAIESYDNSGIMGYLGNSSKNYISSVTTTENFIGESADSSVIEVEYQFDSDGCPTQVQLYDVSSSGRDLYATYYITYLR